MPSPGQQSLSNFYNSVKFRSPLQACLMTEDVIAVGMYSLVQDKAEGQQAANRLREKAKDLPELLRRVLENALKDLGYS